MSRRAPRPVSDALSSVGEGLAPQTPLAAIQAVWERAVGPAIAAEATPVSVRDRTVTVACRSASWAEQLDLLQGELVERLNGELPEASRVRRLRLRADAGEDRG